MIILNGEMEGKIKLDKPEGDWHCKVCFNTLLLMPIFSLFNMEITDRGGDLMIDMLFLLTGRLCHEETTFSMVD